MRPLLIVPALFGTELHDDEQGAIWGTFGCLYRGPRLASLIAEEGPLGHYYRDARELARRITTWSDSLVHTTCRFVVCSGGGPGSYFEWRRTDRAAPSTRE